MSIIPFISDILLTCSHACNLLTYQNIKKLLSTPFSFKKVTFMIFDIVSNINPSENYQRFIQVSYRMILW